MLFYRAALPLPAQVLRRDRRRFGIGTATAWRYVHEAVALLARRSPSLRHPRPTTPRGSPK
ncbi:helix-turn-helix domain-containing protein [Nonomuraea recticatena]|uniref:hypothetical protein n=1 Tax=Nonomuraea recticatena TaxID=46178 RepID=UPI0036213357